MNSTQTLNGFWRPSSVALILISLCSAAVAVWFVIAGLQPDAGEWDISAFLMLAFYAVPAVGIPVLLIRAFRQQRSVRVRKAVPWIARLICLSIILAMIDCTANSYARTSVCSIPVFLIGDGGTTGSVGFGYSLTYWRELSGNRYGPEIWFWFTPIVISAAHHHLELRWIWTNEAGE